MALLGEAFANSLAVRVTANNAVEPVDGGVITFAAPISGALGHILRRHTAIIAGSTVEVTATANSLPRPVHGHGTSALQAAQVEFSLTNKEIFSLVVNTTQDLPRLIGGQNSLRAAIAYADSLTGPQTINFDPSVFGKTSQTIALTYGQLTLSDPTGVTITGPGASLLAVSGNNASRVMEIQGGPAAISGLTVTGGKLASGSNGGGLLNDGGTLSLSNVTISGNTSDDEGGGLYNSKGSLTLTNCTISGNAANTGAGLYNNQGTLTLTDCTISNNTFTLNTPGGVGSGTISGGGLKSLAGTLTMTDCTISGNSARSGAGLFTSFTTTNLTGCVISGNSAAAYNGYPTNPNGGGMYIAGGTVSLYGCTMSGNSAVNGSGGGVYNNNSMLTLTNTTVTGNSAAAKGGGLYNFNAGTLTLVNATITGNSASNGSGVYNSAKSEQEGVMSLTNTIVAGNTKDDISGAYTGSNNLVGGNPMLSPLGDFGGPTPTMVPLAGSLAIGGGTAGAGAPTTDQRGFARGANVDIGAFQTETAAADVNTTEDGAFSTPGLLTLRQAINLAGAVAQPATFDPAVFSTPQVITLTGGPLVISGNAVTINGPGAKLLSVNGGGASGVLEIHGSAATISGLTITGGKAANGGGLYNNGGSLTLTNATVTGNSAQFGGGVANMNSGTTTLTDDTITSNSASQIGGGVISNSGTVTLNDTTLSGNNAPHGGGLANTNSGTTRVTSGTIANNHATSGGGLFTSGGSLGLVDSTVSGNTAPYGGGLDNENGTVTLTGTTVTSNANSNGSLNRGGGLRNSGGYLTVTGGTISGNSSFFSGGGLANVNGGTANLTGTTFSGNYVGQVGGAVYTNSSVSMTNVVISGNTSREHGGAVYVLHGSATLINSTVSNNTAGGGGGGFNLEIGSLALTNCTITGNNGYIGNGGGFSTFEGSMTLMNCTVSGNSSHGGGMYLYSGSTASLTNTIVSGNGGGDTTGGGTFTNTNSLIGGDPLLAPLGDYGGPTQTIALLPGSPAIGAGTSAGAPSKDQRGHQRSGHIDIGAFQSEGFILSTVPGSTPQSTVAGTKFANPLTVTVTPVNQVEPVNGGVVIFTLNSATGASAMLSAGTAVIASGQAAVTATANSTPGNYTVTASAAGTRTVSFALTSNTEKASLHGHDPFRRG